MGKDITTTDILSTCAHCGETVRYYLAGWFSVAPVIVGGVQTRQHCPDGQTHTVDLSHAFSHMTHEG